MSAAARSPLFFIVVGILLGTLATAGALFAESKGSTSMPVPGSEVAGQPFEIVDTPGSTYLLNRSTGQVWRLSFTDVAGNKYWYAMHVPMQQPSSFEEFQTKLRQLSGQK